MRLIANKRVAAESHASISVQCGEVCRLGDDKYPFCTSCAHPSYIYPFSPPYFWKKDSLSFFPSFFYRAALLSVRVSNNARATLAPFHDTPFAHARMTRTPTTLTAVSIYLLVSGNRPLPEFFINVVAARRYQRPTRARERAAGEVTRGGRIFLRRSSRISRAILPLGNKSGTQQRDRSL